MAQVFNFTVSNEDIFVRFSCPNHDRRIEQIVENLCITTQKDSEKKMCRYTSCSGVGEFRFNGVKADGIDIRHEAVFFENTEYPMVVRANNGKQLTDIELAINEHLRSGEGNDSTVISDGGELYGSMNFHNQVGMTDFTFKYKVKGENQYKTMKFMTEVLSYKLDYRSDLRIIISDIENEYAMLSASFLKDTYLSMRQGKGETSNLIWWQIFKSCYEDIVKSAKTIIERPKKRLRSIAKYDRAERMSMIPREMENEYQIHKDNPAYLYRTEDMILSHDTVENRFLKHALNEMLRRFITVKEHIMTAMHLDNPNVIDTSLDEMESELLRLHNHSFFRGVGVFKGFSQDNLVMKQALGYKTIMEKWIELQQGYELEEGMRKLEVKDICDLYEIWCFIKVKNIVQDTLRDMGNDTIAKVNGRDVTRDFIPQLVYGGSVTFFNKDNVELACVSYNSQVEKLNNDKSAIADTETITTVQRPDIVLQLSKISDYGIKYTYLFDAKYRIDDKKIGGNDVPPSDAIDRMHRYRDAIYYTGEGNDHEHLKKEIIAGYVLFPGRIDKDALDLETGDYWYQQSNRKIGIGAFPLRPDQECHNEDGVIIVDPNRKENALRHQIRKWLDDDNPRYTLMKQSIPQKGLSYDMIPEGHEELVLVGYNKRGNETAFLKNGLYYVRAGMDSGSLRIVPGYERCRYLLLYDNKKVEMYKLKPLGPRFVTDAYLKELGFNPRHKYYLAFDLEDNNPILFYIDPKTGRKLNIRKPTNSYMKESYFTTLGEVLEPF